VTLDKEALHIYDTTLRDGAQQEGLNLSVHDKLTIARHLDDLGVGFIEGGWPGANPKDTEFFALAKKELKLKNATFVAFGATRRPNVKAADDVLLGALRDSGAPAVTLVAKAYDRHVDLKKVSAFFWMQNTSSMAIAPIAPMHLKSFALRWKRVLMLQRSAIPTVACCLMRSPM